MDLPDIAKEDSPQKQKATLKPSQDQSQSTQHSEPPNAVVAASPPDAAEDVVLNGRWPLWPDASANIRPVRYCFTDERSLANLEGVVLEAVERWAGATSPSVSSLRFLPASADVDDPSQDLPKAMQLCDHYRNREDALQITDGTRDNDREYNKDCASTTSTGYWRGEPGDNWDDRQWKNQMTFCHLDPHDLSSRPEAVRHMMHELGHAVGLGHEHQRPDTLSHLNLICENLAGYNFARLMSIVKEDGEGFFTAEWTLENRLRMVCQDEAAAREYFPPALPYILDSWARFRNRYFKSYHRSNAFDFDSIMIYSSTEGAKDPNTDRDYVLYRKMKGDTRQPVWMGGYRDPEQARISEGDIARVAQLYPTWDAEQGAFTESKAASLGGTTWRPAPPPAWHDEPDPYDSKT